MTTALLSRRLLDVLLHDWLASGDLCSRPAFQEHTRETFDAVLDTAEQIAVRHLAPHYQASDRDEPRLVGDTVHVHPAIKPALTAMAEAGFFSALHGEAHGGAGLPFSIERSAFALFSAANIATTAYAWLTIANANCLMAHGSPEQVAAYGPHLLSGRCLGTMCLSEPQAGSSLGDILTRAVPDGEGRWRLFGSKMWISGGDHDISDNIIHLVLARIEGAPPGPKGISLFIVPKWLGGADGARGPRNDVTVAGLNHKMGYRGVSNCLLAFGEGRHAPLGAAGAVAELVGAQNAGLAQMFHMMNEARITVGLGAAALACRGYLASLAYAHERPQGRPVSAKTPSSAPVPIIRHADVRHMLLSQKAFAEGGLALCLYAARLVDDRNTAATAEARAEAHLLLELLTPVVKSWPSSYGLAANDLAIQVLGGYGYTRDFPLEQIYRDNRLNPIHEGTHGIQGIDLLGRKVAMAEGRALALYAARVRRTLTELGGHSDWIDAGRQVGARLDELLSVTHRLSGTVDPERRLANASLYLDAFGHLTVAWLWLDLMRAIEGRVGELFDGLRLTCRYFLEAEMGGLGARLERLARNEAMALEMKDAWF
ncbi:MAG: acyl-CoA dehydrogenase [Hyphomicrobiaceae bacterium]